MPVRKKHDRGGEVKEKEKEEENHDKIKLDKQNYKNNTHGNILFFLVLSLEEIVIQRIKIFRNVLSN